MRLIDADALKKEWSMDDVCETCVQDTRQCGNDYCFSRMDVCGMIDDAPTVGGWISVNDRLPETQNPVIVCVPPHTDDEGESYIGYVGMAYYTYSGKGGWWCGTDGALYGAIGGIPTPTHWMLLPEPPEE